MLEDELKRLDYKKTKWKPNYPATAVILLIWMTVSLIMVHAQDGSDLSDGGVEILVESTPYSLRFFLNDTENYALMNVSCKSAKTVEQPGNEIFMCEGLSPCIPYQSTVTIINLRHENQSFFEKIVDANTSYTDPVVEIQEMNPGIDTMYLSWNATDATCISNFQISAKCGEKDFKWTLANDNHELLIDDLNPCMETDIQLKTFDVYNVFKSNLTRTESTEYAEPGNVTLAFEDYENGQKKVTWEPPKYKTCIEYYYLKWFIIGCITPNNLNWTRNISDEHVVENSNEVVEPENPDTETVLCEWSTKITDANAKQYIISDLQGCENYGFDLYINNDVEANSEQTFTSPEQIPGLVTELQRNPGSTNTTLQWSPPKTHSKCVAFYNVYIKGPMQRPEEFHKLLEVKTDRNDAFFDDLDPCGQYDLEIVATSLNGTKGLIMESTFETIETNPSAIQNDVVVTDVFSLEISWDPPAFADLCLNGYRLSVWDDEKNTLPEFDRTTNHTHVKYEALHSCQTYTVQIIPMTKSQLDGDLKQIEAETVATEAQAPNSFQAIGIYSNSLDLSAQDSDFNNKCETIFARFVCQLSRPSADVPYKTAEQYVEGQVGGISFRALLAPLSPFTEYLCSVSLFNVAGWSSNKTIIKKTEPYFPDRPEQIKVKTNTNASLIFNWGSPKFANGNIKLYISHFQRVEANYFIPPGCTHVIPQSVRIETSSLEISYPNLQAYTKYSIQVAAQNEYGVGEYTRPFIVVTEPWISEPVLHLKVVPEGPFESEVLYQSNAVVRWKVPCKSNGPIESFELEFSGERTDHERVYFRRTVLPDFANNDYHSGDILYNETELLPEYNYTVRVVINVKGVSQSSPAMSVEFEAPAGIPKKLNETEMKQSSVDAYEANNPTHSALVRFPANILESDTGTIAYVALLLSQKGCNPKPQLRFGALNSNLDWPTILSWNEVNDDGTDCIQQYQTTPLRWMPINSINQADRADGSDNDIEYTIGSEKCNVSPDRYCNGPLRPDTEYHLVIRLFTKSGYNDVVALEFKTDSLIQLTVIIVSISCLLGLALVAGLIYLWITKRIMWHRESCHGIEDPLGDVLAKNFAIFYREVSKPEKISREFKELMVVAMDLSCSASELGFNKNRYADIFPYDKNRVILDIDAEGSDYINASFIDGHRRKKEYIATQGPKPESTMDFWRMILQYNVRVIVMVTQFREAEQVKCHEYFPFKSKSLDVSVRKKESFELYDRTEMSVTHDMYGLKQKVVHFYFKKWPDHGVPSDPMHLITFVRKVKAERIPSYSPIVVHCSAGVGRTGTFIGLDIIMQRLKSESKINIYETVKKLRFQRMKMVQTLAQYTLLYTCTYELVKHKATRAALKYKTKTVKKVSFEDDAESNVDTKLRTRRNGTRLSPVEEIESTYNAGDAIQKQMTTIGSGTIKFNELRKKPDLECLEERNQNEESSKNNSTESVI